jgi:hypothetical protein
VGQDINKSKRKKDVLYEEISKSNAKEVQNKKLRGFNVEIQYYSRCKNINVRTCRCIP